MPDHVKPPIIRLPALVAIEDAMVTMSVPALRVNAEGETLIEAFEKLKAMVTFLNKGVPIEISLCSENRAYWIESYESSPIWSLLMAKKIELHKLKIREAIKNKKIQSAPRDKLFFVQDLADDFLKQILDIEDAYITDESRLHDFNLHPPEEAIGPGYEDGTLRFSFTKSFDGSDVYCERDYEPDKSFSEIIKLVSERYGVDMNGKLNAYFVDILFYIREQTKGKY